MREDVAHCPVCGAYVDLKGYQVVLPGDAHVFDRVECAARARVPGGPAPRVHRPVPEAHEQAPAESPIEPLEQMAAELFMERVERRNERLRLETLEAENARLAGRLEELSDELAALETTYRRPWWERLRGSHRAA